MNTNTPRLTAARTARRLRWTNGTSALERGQHVVGADQPECPQQAQEAQVRGQRRQQQRGQHHQVDDGHRLAQILQGPRRDVEPEANSSARPDGDERCRPQHPAGGRQEGGDQEEGDGQQVEGQQRQLEAGRPRVAAEIELAQARPEVGRGRLPFRIGRGFPGPRPHASPAEPCRPFHPAAMAGRPPGKQARRGATAWNP